ncbi:OpgC domain-containing protein, partial [Enterovibrio norvegicus]
MKRIPALDSIRGLLLLLMTINHLFWISGGRSPVQYFTSEPLGPFGPAEGFVFISALLAGAIYSRDALSNADVRTKAFHRALTLYRYHIVCLIAVFIWFLASKYTFPMHQNLLAQNFPNLLTAPLETLLFSAALINKPNYFDILPLYIIFMLLLPLLIAMYRKGLFLVVLGASVLLWLASGTISEGQLNAVVGSLSEGTALSAGYFDPFAWQLLFVVGSAIGFQLQHGNLIRWHHPFLTFLSIAGISIMFAAHHGAFLNIGIHRGIIYDLADKSELGWLRLLTLSMWV